MRQESKSWHGYFALIFLFVALAIIYNGVRSQPQSRLGVSVNKVRESPKDEASPFPKVQKTTSLLKVRDDLKVVESDQPIEQPGPDDIVQLHMAKILSSPKPESAAINAINAMPFPEDSESRFELIKQILESRAVKPSAVAFIADSELFSRLVYDKDSVQSPEADADTIIKLFKLYVDSKSEADAVNGISEAETTKTIAKNLGEFITHHPNANVRNVLSVKIPEEYPDLCSISAKIPSAKLQNYFSCI